MPKTSSVIQQEPVFHYYNPATYLIDLVKRLNAAQAGTKVLVMTMVFDATEPRIATITHALLAASRRGVEVYFAIDAYNFLVTSGGALGPLWGRKKLPNHLRGLAQHNYAALQKLQAAGVKTVITNPPTRAFSNPFSGRSHIKLTVIGDYTYVGGCNLDMPTHLKRIDNIDSMVGWSNSTTAEWFLKTMRPVFDSSQLKSINSHDISHKISPDTNLLVDIGHKKQSIIYKNALQLIDEAQKWLLLSCQFLPNGKTAEHLLAAYGRGVNVTLLFNDPGHHSGIFVPIQNLVRLREKRRLPQSSFETTIGIEHGYLHAKILASEQAAMIGSHNYVPSGVNFGTAELTLHSRNQGFIKQTVEALVVQTPYVGHTRFDLFNSSLS